MTDTNQIVKEITAAAQRWAAAFNAGDAAGCARMYEEDARMHPAPFDEVHGSANIKAFWQKMMDDGFGDVRYLDPAITVISQDIAHLTSPWSMNKAAGVIHKEVWKRQTDGRWLLHDDHFEVTG